MLNKTEDMSKKKRQNLPIFCFDILKTFDLHLKLFFFLNFLKDDLELMKGEKKNIAGWGDSKQHETSSGCDSSESYRLELSNKTASESHLAEELLTKIVADEKAPHVAGDATGVCVQADCVTPLSTFFSRAGYRSIVV